jgi:hypothetical protein
MRSLRSLSPRWSALNNTKRVYASWKEMWCLQAARLRRGEREKKMKGTYFLFCQESTLTACGQKKYAEFDNVDCSKLPRLPRSWQHVLRGRGIARICDRICREDRSLGKHPALTRTDPHAHAREYKRALPLALSEYDEENFLVNDRTIPRPHLNDIRWTALKRCAFPTIWSWLGKFYRQRIHERTLPCPHFEGRTLDPHTRCLATSKADKEKIKINERTIPRPHLDDVRWTQTGLCLCVWGGSGCW